MPDNLTAINRRRRSAGCAAAVLLGLLTGPLFGQQPPTTQPATQPVTTQPAKPETIAETRARLKATKLSDREAALVAALDLVVALGAADGPRAAELIDAVGYEPLPMWGPLPLDPPRPIPRDEIATRFAQRPRAPLDLLPPTCLDTMDQKTLLKEFPAAGTWMLPQDWAVIIRPIEGQTGWVSRRTYLIVRVRAGKPAIIGGDLLAALAQP
ncbi:MAG: hypothetical protein PVJ57_18055 [Phycisphaerae bacterium]|jgi:hypothetical protein